MNLKRWMSRVLAIRGGVGGFGSRRRVSAGYQSAAEVLEPRTVLTDLVPGVTQPVEFNPQALLTNGTATSLTLTFCGGTLMGYSTLTVPDAYLTGFGLVLDGALLPNAPNCVVPVMNDSTIYFVAVVNNQVTSITATPSVFPPTPPVAPIVPEVVATSLSGTSPGSASGTAPNGSPTNSSSPKPETEDPLSPQSIFETAQNLVLQDPNEPLELKPQQGLDLQSGTNNELPKLIPLALGPLSSAGASGIIFAKPGGQDSYGAVGVGVQTTPIQLLPNFVGMPLTVTFGGQGSLIFPTDAKPGDAYKPGNETTIGSTIRF